LTFPNADSDGPQHTTVEPLAPLIREILEKENSVNRIEVLSWPEEGHQQWVIFPDSETAPEQVDHDDELGELDGQQQLTDNSTTSADREERSPITGAVRSVLEDTENESIPSSFGYEVCDVDFAPLEQAIRPTCRLVVGANPDLQPLGRREPHPIAGLITDLNAADIPYLFQTIVSVGRNADYEVSQRLAVYPPQYGIGVEQDFANFLTQGAHTDLSEYYDPYVGKIRSNFDLEARDFFTIDGTGPDATVRKRTDRGEALVKRARRIIKGHKECHKLYAGYHDTDQDLETLYRYRDYYTKIPASGVALSAFLAVVPVYIDHSPWGNINYADPPTIISRPAQLPSDAEQDDKPAATADHSSTGETDSPTFVTQGSEEHQFDEQFVAEYYQHRGFEVDRSDTGTTGSVPDLVLQKDGTTYLGEVERSGTSRPANVLTNAARAVHFDFPVYFFAKDKSAAKTIAKILRDPVRTHTDTGARLYTQSKALTLKDGGKPLLPADASVSKSKWFLKNDMPDPSATADSTPPETQPADPTATLELRANGRVIASGPVTDAVATYDYDTEIVQEESVPDSRTRIHPPFVPTKLAYLATSTIRYQRGNKELVTYEPDDYQPGWDYTDDEGKRKRYTAAFRAFIENKTIPVSDGEILKQEAISVLKRELYEPQTSRKVPGMKEAARALWQHAEKKSNNRKDESGKVDKLKDRTWRWPRGVTSPDLPFADTSPHEFDVEQWL
jgi:hypothetical protein